MKFFFHLILKFSGTEVNKKVMETLQKSWAILEQNAEQYGLSLFRYINSIVCICLGRDRRGSDHMVVGYATTCAINGFYH